MTEQEAIYCMKAVSERYSHVCEECPLYGETGCDHCYDDANDMAIKALEEIQQYRALGTVEELRVARDKQVGKKIDKSGYVFMCPICRTWLKSSQAYCHTCGQKLNREEV